MFLRVLYLIHSNYLSYYDTDELVGSLENKINVSLLKFILDNEKKIRESYLSCVILVVWIVWVTLVFRLFAFFELFKKSIMICLSVV